ncbi:MAG: alpha/beta-hydrolase family protein [Alphaproteobacteria bacterium]|nr:alpha/beta-hydrolase family protein [Alphaproteobacteria bacterium]
MQLINWLKNRVTHFSFMGVLIGSLFFALSLTPSLIPRDFLFQGILAGLCFALGYGSGVFIRWVWQFLELPPPKPKLLGFLRRLTVVLVAIILIYCLWHSVAWQNSIRELMDMPPLVSSNAIIVGLIGLSLAFILILISQYIYELTSYANKKLQKYLPRRVVLIVGPLFIAIFLINIFNGVIAKSVLHILDASFQKTDKLFADGQTAPTENLASGSAQSIVKWADLGRLGRKFVISGPTQAQISAFTTQPAQQPLRIYVGLNSAATAQQRAELALQEMLRVDAFSRKILVIANPTGTGWVDPMSVNTLEYMHAGDTAIVSMQYSYLASWLSLLAEPEVSAQSAKALFNVVYKHWTNLPKNARPKLYLNGLSLGSHGSELSANLITMLSDPINGALWAGPPFANSIWRSLTDTRDAGSPAWLPKIGDSSIVRFTSETNALQIAGAKWGEMRIVYVQHASDGIVFFDMEAAFKQPDWMIGERGPDVSPELRWYPIVTFVQLLLDMATAIIPPLGYGHTYGPNGYIDAWAEVTAPEGWDEADSDSLKAIFANEIKRE